MCVADFFINSVSMLWINRVWAKPGAQMVKALVESARCEVDANWQLQKSLNSKRSSVHSEAGLIMLVLLSFAYTVAKTRLKQSVQRQPGKKKKTLITFCIPNLCIPWILSVQWTSMCAEYQLLIYSLPVEPEVSDTNGAHPQEAAMLQILY